MPPPASKNARSTCRRASRWAVLPPTSKVFHEPMPITGRASPVAGIALVRIGPGWAVARNGASPAAMPSAARTARRFGPEWDRLMASALGSREHPFCLRRSPDANQIIVRCRRAGRPVHQSD